MGLIRHRLKAPHIVKHLQVDREYANHRGVPFFAPKHKTAAIAKKHVSNEGTGCRGWGGYVK
jgi:hypothetical protein